MSLFTRLRAPEIIQSRIDSLKSDIASAGRYERNRKFVQEYEFRLEVLYRQLNPDEVDTMTFHGKENGGMLRAACIARNARRVKARRNGSGGI